MTDQTRIIPGHGPLSRKTDLNNYLSMLKILRSNIQKLLADGKSQEEVIAANPTADYDETWGQGFLSPEKFVTILYNDLSRRQSKN